MYNPHPRRHFHPETQDLGRPAQMYRVFSNIEALERVVCLMWYLDENWISYLGIRKDRIDVVVRHALSEQELETDISFSPDLAYHQLHERIKS